MKCPGLVVLAVLARACALGRPEDEAQALRFCD
jgi:hypothetical protein